MYLFKFHLFYFYFQLFKLQKFKIFLIVLLFYSLKNSPKNVSPCTVHSYNNFKL